MPDGIHVLKGTNQQLMRLNRILSSAGLTSRRKADEWIRAGRVKINNRVVREPGIKAVWGHDRITVDGKDIPGQSERIYLMLNKPFGYISSLSDPMGRPVVTELLTDIPQRVFPVGRLDFDSMGLLLLTNDGDWSYRLTHPRFQVPKTYKVTVEGKISQGAIDRLNKGVLLKDGPSGPSRTRVISTTPRRSVLRMTIYQGKNRQVRRMLEAVGYRVIHLIRIGFGPLELGNLKIGQYRRLTPREVNSVIPRIFRKKGRC